MSLKIKIEGEIKQAMLNKDKNRLTALRSVKSLILLAETEKGAKTSLTDEAEMKLLTKAAKQRRDSMQIYEQQKRNDLAQIEAKELAIIEEFLPAQLNESQVRAEVEKIIAQMGASEPQEMGKVMGVATKALAGRSDGKMIARIVRELLN